MEERRAEGARRATGGWEDAWKRRGTEGGLGEATAWDGGDRKGLKGISGRTYAKGEGASVHGHCH